MKEVENMLEVILRTLYNLVILSDTIRIDYLDCTDESCPYGYETSIEFRKFWDDEKQSYFFRQYVWTNDDWKKRMILYPYELELFITDFADVNNEEYEEYDNIDIMFFRYMDPLSDELELIGRKNSYDQYSYI